MEGKPNDAWEKRHRQLIELRILQIEAQFDQVIVRLASYAAQFDILKDGNGKAIPVNIQDFPGLQADIKAAVDALERNIEITIRAGVTDAWDLSKEKNFAYIDRRFPVSDLPQNVTQVLYDPMKPALEKFLAKVRDGNTLSDQVWRIGKAVRAEVTAALELGIAEGASAVSMVSEVRQFLNNPDMLWRRIRNAKGELVLPAQALEIHPGKGVYRSSKANALRLTRTEINMAYRTADQERWQANPMVVGYRISLSHSHPRADLCNDLEGDYPKWFVFIGWHPNCFCISTAILMTDAEFRRYRLRPLDSSDTSFVKYVSEIPSGARAWLDENGPAIDAMSSTPYWVEDNFKNGTIGDGLKGK